MGRSDESVAWALRELEIAIASSSDEPRAREALTVLRQAFTNVRACASTDQLTGLANRASFYALLEERFLGQAPSAREALLFLDLDGFKEVNDRRGHQVGDLLLTEVAGRIAGSVREQDLVARHGGDEFVVLLSNIENPSIAHAVAARVIEAISAPFSIEGHRIRLGVSIGVAYYPEHGSSVAELVKRADVAMYSAKNAGGQSYAVFGEREGLSLPRPSKRSWAWELSPAAQRGLEQPPDNDLLPLREEQG